MDTAPTTLKTAWANLLDGIIESGVCWREGGQPDGEWRPRCGPMNYGEAVIDAFSRLESKGKGMTIDQIVAVEQLCKWIARAARQTDTPY